MKRIFHFALMSSSLLFLTGCPAGAQSGPPTFQYTNSVPSGSCSSSPTPPIQIIFNSALAYSCNNGTWAPFGGGSGGGSVVVVSAPSASWPTWLVPTVTNSTTTPSLAVVASAIPNAALANPSITLGTTNIPLGTTVSTAAGFLAPLATALATTPSLCGSGNAPRGVDAGGNALNCQAISSGGGGATLQVNGTNTLSQTLQNLVNTGSIAATNPSGGVVNLALVSTGASTLAGFNASNAYTDFTIGSGLGIVGGALVNTSPASAGVTGSGTVNCVPVFTAGSVLGCSSATDNGTIFSISDTGGLQLSGTTPGAYALAGGSGNLPNGLPANSVGEVGPLSGGTSWARQWPANASTGYPIFGPTATLYGVPVAPITFQFPNAPITVVSNQYGSYGANSWLSGIKAAHNGQFTNIQVSNTSPGTCTTSISFNVVDRTQGTSGAPATVPVTGAAAGVLQDTAQTLQFSAGDDIGLIVAAGGGCGNFFGVSAQYQDR